LSAAFSWTCICLGCGLLVMSACSLCSVIISCNSCFAHCYFPLSDVLGLFFLCLQACEFLILCCALFCSCPANLKHKKNRPRTSDSGK
jgi:hypothetical protein